MARKKNSITKSFTFEGKRYYANGPSEEVVTRKLIEKKTMLEKGMVLIESNMPLNKWAQYCIDLYKINLSDLSLVKYKNRMKNCVTNYFGAMPLKSVKPLHCQKCINLQPHKSQYQINQTYQMLNFIFNKAVENKLINYNPAANITKPKGSVNKRRSLTDYERKILLQVADSHSKGIYFLLMLFCGLRPSEAAEAKYEDIIESNNRKILHVRGTKTKSADRHVPLPDYVYDKIKLKSGYLCVNNYGNKLTTDNRKHAWESFKRDMNIAMGCKLYRNQIIETLVAKDLVPYCLRHTYCTDLAKAGVDIRLAQYLMGHSDIKMTANIYTHFDFKDAANVVLDVVPSLEPVRI